MPLLCLLMDPTLPIDTVSTMPQQGGRAVDGTLSSTETLQIGSDRWQPGPSMVLPRTALAAAALQVPLCRTMHAMHQRHWHTAHSRTLHRHDCRVGGTRCLPDACVACSRVGSCACQDVVYAIGGQGNQGKAVHPSIERLDGERFVLLPQQMKAERKYVSASAFAGD
jgi:hypothetical protein